MAYENDGTARSLKVQVTKKQGGNIVQGYPVTYDGQLSWGDVLYPTLTDTEARQLSDVDFTARYNAFVAYVEGIEAGSDFDTDIVGDGATKYDPINCGTTTTTTVAAQPVYAFSIKYGKYPVDVCAGTDAVVYTAVQTPNVGNTLYQNAELTQIWNVTNGEHVKFVSPILYGEKAVEVSLTTGKITSITTFDCGDVSPVVKNLSISVMYNDMGDIEEGAESACNLILLTNNGNADITGTISITQNDGSGDWCLFTASNCGSNCQDSESFTIPAGESVDYSVSYQSASGDSGSRVTENITITHNADNLSSPLTYVTFVDVN